MAFASHSISHFSHPTGLDTKQKLKRYSHCRNQLLSIVAVIDFNTQIVLDLTDDGIDPANHEVVTDNLEVGISIKNLTKIFGLVNLLPYPPKNKPLSLFSTSN